MILVIFFSGLALSALTFVLQYYGYCPAGPSYALPPYYWTHRQATAPNATERKKTLPGLPEHVAERLNSYSNVNDIPHQVGRLTCMLQVHSGTANLIQGQLAIDWADCVISCSPVTY